LPDYPQYPDNNHHGDDPSYGKIYLSWEKIFKPVPMQNAHEHDIVAIRNNCESVNHLGLVISPNHFIHILEGPNCCIQKLSKWRNRIDTIARWRGIL